MLSVKHGVLEIDGRCTNEAQAATAIGVLHRGASVGIGTAIASIF
jgi:hypothetical protein